jgi:phage baseplate assembly protein gpV
LFIVHYSLFIEIRGWLIMDTRIGRVSSVNAAARTARVSFSGGMTSAVLKVLKTSDEDWLPSIGSSVLCLFLPNGEGDGIILGGL